MQTFGLSQYITVPTRKTVTTNTLLDVIYIKTDKIIHPYMMKTAVSNHYLVGCVRYLNYAKPEKTTEADHIEV